MGLIILFVDDIICAGKPTFNSVINKFKAIFHAGAENEKAFINGGINVKQKEDILPTLISTHMLRV